jgi:hypothetical protein
VRKLLSASTGGRDAVKKVLVGAALAFLVLSLIGGYGLHWKWTGFQDNGSVWDWLNLFLLPVTLAFVPMALSAARAGSAAFRRA